MCEALRELMKDEIDAEVEKRVKAEVEKRVEEKVTAEVEKRVKEAREEAEKKTFKNGEDRLNKLFCRLEQDNRKDDIFRAIKDSEYLAKLYKEYGMA